MEIDPLGRWVVVFTRGETRLFPIPVPGVTPLHRLPLEDLLAELRSMTNARLNEDPEVATGWTLGWDPFPGWDPPAKP
jgi:hypothetical protein